MKNLAFGAKALCPGEFVSDPKSKPSDISSDGSAKHILKACVDPVFYLRNRKHFPCLHTVIETRVEIWENEKLKFPKCLSVSITYVNAGKCFLFLL